jgi:hypothetical protein
MLFQLLAEVCRFHLDGSCRMPRRRRSQQTTTLQARIEAFSRRVCAEVDATTDPVEKATLLRKLRAAETATELERQLSAGHDAP